MVQREFQHHKRNKPAPHTLGGRFLLYDVSMDDDNDDTPLEDDTPPMDETPHEDENVGPDVETLQAKISQLNGLLADSQAANQLLKAQNYDLLMAQPAEQDSGPEPEANSEDISDLFIEE